MWNATSVPSLGAAGEVGEALTHDILLLIVNESKTYRWPVALERPRHACVEHLRIKRDGRVGLQGRTQHEDRAHKLARAERAAEGSVGWIHEEAVVIQVAGRIRSEHGIDSEHGVHREGLAFRAVREHGGLIVDTLECEHTRIVGRIASRHMEQIFGRLRLFGRRFRCAAATRVCVSNTTQDEQQCQYSGGTASHLHVRDCLFPHDRSLVLSTSVSPPRLFSVCLSVSLFLRWMRRFLLPRSGPMKVESVDRA